MSVRKRLNATGNPTTCMAERSEPEEKVNVMPAPLKVAMPRTAVALAEPNTVSPALTRMVTTPL